MFDKYTEELALASVFLFLNCLFLPVGVCVCEAGQIWQYLISKRSPHHSDIMAAHAANAISISPKSESKATLTPAARPQYATYFINLVVDINIW